MPAARVTPRAQGRQDSNLQQPVLETGTLPIELRPSESHPPLCPWSICPWSSRGERTPARAVYGTAPSPLQPGRIAQPGRPAQEPEVLGRQYPIPVAPDPLAAVTLTIRT